MIRKNNLFNYDIKLIAAVIIIVTIGILTIYSAGFDTIDNLNSGLYRKQIMWFIIGFIFLMIFSFIDYKILGDLSLYIYIIMLMVLIITTLFGKPIRNTRAWISLGMFSIQPSEFMKLSLVIILAKYLELRERDIKLFRELLIPSILTIVPVLFIVKQPDFGTAMIFVPILFTMLFVGGADVSHIFSIISIALISLIIPIFITYQEYLNPESTNVVMNFFRSGYAVFIVSIILLLFGGLMYLLHLGFVNKWYRRLYIPSFTLSLGLTIASLLQRYLQGYQKRRILVFINPEIEPQGAGYNVIQSKIAIGSGGFFGKGFLKGTQTQLGFLPETASDFIFSVVAEEWGFFGVIIIISLLFFIIYSGIKIAVNSTDKFGAMLAVGISSIFFFHVMINIGMAVGIMPVTGLPLCFISYGGSNILMAMIGIGILLSINSKKKNY